MSILRAYLYLYQNTSPKLNVRGLSVENCPLMSDFVFACVLAVVLVQEHGCLVPRASITPTFGITTFNVFVANII